MNDVLRRQAEERPDSPAVITAEGVVTWATLEAQVTTTARSLAETGAGEGDVVAVDADGSIRTLVVLHAAWRLGVAAAPLHPKLTARERQAAIDALEGFEPEPPKEPGLETAAILWTSGSTGSPRGIVLPARAFRHNALATASRLSLDSSDRWLTTLSLAHVGGLAMVARAAHVGSAVVLADAFATGSFHDRCRAHHVTHASLVPTMLLRLVNEGRPAPPSLRAVLVGGAAATPELVSRAIGLGYPVALTYGLTEAGSQVATATPDETRADVATVGRALDGVELRIDDRDRICVRGPTLATAIVGEGSLPIDDDGWLVTGDVGALDENGVLRVGGRADTRIITGGVNVDPLEVERALTALDGVKEACVVGRPDPEWGMRVEAVVVLDEGADSLDGEALRTELAEQLSPAKLPKAFHTLDALPVNRNGKVDRAAVVGLIESTSR